MFVILVAALWAGCATSAFALAVAWTRPHSLKLLDDGAWAGLLTALGLAALCGAITAWHVTRARHASAREIRAGFSAAVLTVAGYVAGFAAFKMLFLVLYLGVAVGIWAALVLAARCSAGFARAIRPLDFALFTLCLSAVVAEVALRVVPLVSDNPVFERATTPHRQIDRYRLAPGELHFGFPANGLGYPDVEPARRDGRRFIASIGDSFSQGVVPHAFHYTTVCEDVLGDVDVANFGVTTIGPAEYAVILDEHVMPTRPDAVVIALFVGNDVHDAMRYRDDYAFWRAVFGRDRCALVQVPRRMARLQAERDRVGDGAGQVEGAAHAEPVTERGALLELYPWLDDPMREPPTFSPEAYRDAEYTRIAAACNPHDLEAYDRLFTLLDGMIERAKPTPVWFLLIPDEFQVEDAVWNDALTGRDDAAMFERLLPQAKIVPWLRSRGIPHLDLLPILRAVPPLEDGDRHLYHLRDTHFNARGNRFTGEALAEFLRGR